MPIQTYIENQSEIIEIPIKGQGLGPVRFLFGFSLSLSIYLSIDPLSVAVLIKTLDDGSSRAAKALLAGHN